MVLLSKMVIHDDCMMRPGGTPDKYWNIITQYYEWPTSWYPSWFPYSPMIFHIWLFGNIQIKDKSEIKSRITAVSWGIFNAKHSVRLIDQFFGRFLGSTWEDTSCTECFVEEFKGWGRLCQLSQDRYHESAENRHRCCIQKLILHSQLPLNPKIAMFNENMEESSYQPHFFQLPVLPPRSGCLNRNLFKNLRHASWKSEQYGD